jgi:hypothetical protein
MTSSPPSPESTQLAVLHALDASPTGDIPDTRDLIVKGKKMEGAPEQILVKAAVDSLWRKEVSLSPPQLP